MAGPIPPEKLPDPAQMAQIAPQMAQVPGMPDPTQAEQAYPPPFSVAGEEGLVGSGPGVSRPRSRLRRLSLGVRQA